MRSCPSCGVAVTDSEFQCRNCSGDSDADRLFSMNAEIERLKAEVAELRKENEGLLKLDVHTLNIVRGRMDATLGGNAVVRIMAASYAEMFRNAGGENFCTSTLTDRSDEENPLTLEVTIRRYPDGKTPEVVIGELKAQLSASEAKRKVLREEAKASRGWRGWRSMPGGPDQSEFREWWDDAIKATDAASALEGA